MSMVYLTSPNATGLKMPALGLGTWLSSPEEVKEAVNTAIDIGYRYIDCAFLYKNEKQIGEVLAEKMAAKVVKREELFITSKLWNTFHRPDLVKKGCQQSLQNLKLDYVDLYLMHWPMAFAEEGDMFPKDENGDLVYSDADYLETWKAMEELVDSGLCRAIGLSNFNSRQIGRVLEHCRVRPANLQVEISPYFTNRRLVDFARSHGMTVTAYCPLGNPSRPWAKPDEPKLLEEPMLQRIGEKYGKTPAQILIRFQLDSGIGVIPKSVKPSRIRENFDVLDFSLTKEEVEEVASLDKNFRAVVLPALQNHRHYPFSEVY